MVAVDIKRERARSYTVLVRRIAEPGLRSLVVSVAEQERDHADAMQHSRELAIVKGIRSKLVHLN